VKNIFAPSNAYIWLRKNLVTLRHAQASISSCALHCCAHPVLLFAPLLMPWEDSLEQFGKDKLWPMEQYLGPSSGDACLLSPFSALKLKIVLIVVILSVQRLQTRCQAYVKSWWCCEFMMTSMDYFSFWLSRMLGATSCRVELSTLASLLRPPPLAKHTRICLLGSVKWFTLVFHNWSGQRNAYPLFVFPEISQSSQEINSVGVKFLTYKEPGHN
jgi:hypothetical protein